MSDAESSIAKAKSEAALGDERYKGNLLERISNDKVRYGEAAEHYNRAGNFFKLGKDMNNAGEMYKKAAQCFLSVDQKHDASAAFANASKCYQKIDINESLTLHAENIRIMLDEGQFSIAARCQKEIAEMLEQERDYERAIENYIIAADYFSTSSTNLSNCDACNLKAAHLLTSIEPPQFDKAADLFEKCGQSAASASGTVSRTFSAKEYLLKAALCRLAQGDVVGTKRAIESYGSFFFQWPSSNEYLFIQRLINAIDDYDSEGFTAAVQDWNSTMTLDKWRTSVLLKIKDTIEDPDSNPLL